MARPWGSWPDPPDVLPLLIQDAADKKDQESRGVAMAGAAPPRKAATPALAAQVPLEADALSVASDGPAVDEAVDEAVNEAAAAASTGPADPADPPGPADGVTPTHPFGKARTTVSLECLYGLARELDLPTVKCATLAIANPRCPPPPLYQPFAEISRRWFPAASAALTRLAQPCFQQPNDRGAAAAQTLDHGEWCGAPSYPFGAVP